MTPSAATLVVLASALLIPACGPGDGGHAADPVPAASTSVTTAAAEEPAGWWERPEEDLSPPTARWPMVESLRADRDSPRHPSDGGGTVVLEPLEDGSDGARVGRPGRWRLVYTAGPHGVAAQGAVFLQISPYWGWSEPFADPQGRLPPELRDGRPGFTTVTTDAVGVEPRAVHLDQTLMGIFLDTGRGLAEGERLVITYGAGAAGARPDSYADRESRFWLAVDGDGDGVRALVPGSPTVDVAAGPAAQLVAFLPSCVEPGAEARLTVAVLDAAGSAGVDWSGALTVTGAPAGCDLPATLALRAEDGARRTLGFRCPEEGVVRLTLTAPEGWSVVTNPMIVQADVEPILWGDLHGHSGLSDGTGTPEDYFAYARDVAALDVVALTDHDHWGFEFLDQHPEMWERIRDAAAAVHEPGRFVSVLGYEWTSWIHGHRHVLSFEEQPRLDVLSSLDERYETPRQLWDAVAGRRVLTFAHHSAGGPIAVNWTFRPDPRVEPVTEIMSVHGSSEAPDSPLGIYRPVPGNSVRDVLDAGLRFGFIGSGDSHDGHPGLAHLAEPRGAGGLVALLTGAHDRAGVLEALRERRVYATSGARMILRASLDGHRLGATLPAPAGPARLTLLVRGTAPVQHVDLIRSGAVVDRLVAADGDAGDLLAHWSLERLAAGEYVYLRVVQRDGHVGWTSPFFVDAAEDAGG